MADTLTGLHLSDLHFGHGQEARHRVDQPLVGDEMLRDAGELAARRGPPDLIFLTGDLAYQAAPPQAYPRAAVWLDRRLAAAHARPDRRYVTPGHPDVDRRLVTALGPVILVG